MPSGGYRAPENPAVASGPGSLSRRTDGGPGQPEMPITGQPYGAGKALRAQMQAAPMADVSDAPKGVAQAPPQQGPQLVPLDAPTQFPKEPITAGAPFGPGPGPGPQQVGFRVTDLLQSLLGSDIAGDLADLYLEAERMGL